jgi:DNA-binding transcriptional MocR family regulator
VERVEEAGGFELERSALADWVGQSAALLRPLVEVLALRDPAWDRAAHAQRDCQYQNADQHHQLSIRRKVALRDADGWSLRNLTRLRDRLDGARTNVNRAFEKMGLMLLAEPNAGMFVWARFPEIEDTPALAERALREGFMLAPGNVFRPHLEPTPWMRFNVAVCDELRVLRWMERIATTQSNSS